MSRPSVVFAGTPEFSVPCLASLLDSEVDVVGVYTQPDRVAGRGKKIQQSPVKQFASKAGLEVFQPLSFKKKLARESLAALQADLMVVVAYGLILPPSVLATPTLGCINIHASLLPRWRGAAPIARAIEAGDDQTGVCLMKMEQGLDTGPIIACQSTLISDHETGGSLHDTLSLMGADLLTQQLDNILQSRVSLQAQTETGVRYAHKLSKEETRVDWRTEAQKIANKIRAFNPWPTVSTTLNGQVIRLHHALADDAVVNDQARTGEILSASRGGIVVKTGDGILCITELQKPGGKKLSAGDFLNGFSITPGQQFD